MASTLPPTSPQPQHISNPLQSKFDAICASGSKNDMQVLFRQLENPLSLLYRSGLCDVARHGHISLLEYLSEEGFYLFFTGMKTVPGAAAEYGAKTGYVEEWEGWR